MKTKGFEHGWGLGRAIVCGLVITLFTVLHGFAQTTNSAPPLLSSSLPNAAPSVIRVMGALVLVIGVFLGGTWLFRNAQQLRFRRGRSPRLQILESRSLGGRHALFVVAYDQERLLVSSSPGGVSLLTHLPAGSEVQNEPAMEEKFSASTAAPMPFREALARVIKGGAAVQPPGGRP